LLEFLGTITWFDSIRLGHFMPFLVKEKGSKSSKIRKLTRKFTLPPFWPFLKFLKSTMEVVDMLVRFPRNYYMLRFDKARPLYALFIERKRDKNE
jgi:hypothetical protein